MSNICLKSAGVSVPPMESIRQAFGKSAMKAISVNVLLSFICKWENQQIHLYHKIILNFIYSNFIFQSVHHLHIIEVQMRILYFIAAQKLYKVF